MTLTEFLMARIAEDEAFGNVEHPDPILRDYAKRVLAECEAKRRIVELHESWPVLVETEPRFERAGGDLDSMTFRMSQQIQWQTTQEYRARFGDDPPAAPMLRHLAAVYADHPDYRDEWRP